MIKFVSVLERVKGCSGHISPCPGDGGMLETRRIVVMVYNYLFYSCCSLSFVPFTLHMLHLFFPAFINANLYLMISLFFYTQQLTIVIIFIQPATAINMFNFTVDAIQCHNGNG